MEQMNDSHICLATLKKKTPFQSKSVQSCQIACASSGLINDKLWGTARRSSLNYEKASNQSIVLIPLFH